MVLFAYRTTPIDGLDITPFEVIYGRKPNLPIDNLLFRENYDKPITNMEEYMNYLFDNQENMFEAVQKERKDRFDRNKRAAGEHKTNRTYKVGDKVYLSFPKGRFRKAGDSMKLSHRNDGPYTVLEEIQGGLVYRLKHDRNGYVHTTSVGRMMPVSTMVMPANAVDLPLSDAWKQLTPRTDRINDIPEAKQKEETQQALREANDETKNNDVLATKAADEAKREEEEEEEFNLEDDDYDFESENEEDDEHTKNKKRAADPKEQPMKKKAKTKATEQPEPAMQLDQSAAATAAIEPEALGEYASGTSKEKPKKERKPRQAYQPEYERFYRTGAKTRADRLKQRALRAGRTDVVDEMNIGWFAIAPSANKQSPDSRSNQQRTRRAQQRKQLQREYADKMLGQVTPAGGKEPPVRLGTSSAQKQNRKRVGCTHCTAQQWEGLAEPYSFGDSFMKGTGVIRSVPRNSLQITPRT
jgi:hypothetical protein